MAESIEVGTGRPPDDEPPLRPEPMSLARLALTEKAPVEVLERIVALEERVADRNARAAFFRALSELQSEVGSVPKTSEIKVTRAGTQEVRSRYASLDTIFQHIRPLLTKHGFIVNWNSKFFDTGMVRITAYLRHIDGHTESADFEFPQKDAAAPGMNGVQIAGSARTYGERYSLIQVLGLTTADPDTDGVDEDAEASTKITLEDVTELDRMILESGANRKRFLQFLGVEHLSDLTRRDYDKAVRALDEKAKQKAEAS